jgi:hypothetical protein
MTELMRKISKSMDVRNTIGMVFTMMSFLFLFRLLYTKIPPENKDVVIAIAGVIVGQLVTINGYYFGQSKSEVEQQKSDRDEKGKI